MADRAFAETGRNVCFALMQGWPFFNYNLLHSKRWREGEKRKETTKAPFSLCSKIFQSNVDLWQVFCAHPYPSLKTTWRGLFCFEETVKCSSVRGFLFYLFDRRTKSCSVLKALTSPPMCRHLVEFSTTATVSLACYSVFNTGHFVCRYCTSH